MKKMILAVATAMMFLGCESPLDSTPYSEYSEQASVSDSVADSVEIGLVHRGYNYVKTVENGNITQYVQVSSQVLNDTFWLTVPNIDSIGLVNENSKGTYNNFVQVVAESCYKLRYKR